MRAVVGLRGGVGALLAEGAVSTSGDKGTGRVASGGSNDAPLGRWLRAWLPPNAILSGWAVRELLSDRRCGTRRHSRS
jgi:hypothetical protein